MITKTRTLLWSLTWALGASALAQPSDRSAIRPQAGDIVWIPGGWFARGSDAADVAFAVRQCARERQRSQERICVPEMFQDETPRERVWVSAFGIDRTEVTRAAWRTCMLAQACPPTRLSATHPSQGERLPVAGVTWTEAEAYCRWAGGRLPTEAQWERAARGTDARRYPWGRSDPRGRANQGRLNALPPELEPDSRDGYRHTAPVGAYPSGVSPYGLLDMAGNVFEWTADRYSPEGYARGDRVDPTGVGSGGERAVRGGSYRFPAYGLRVTYRLGLAEDHASADVGFRCAYPRDAGG